MSHRPPFNDPNRPGPPYEPGKPYPWIPPYPEEQKRRHMEMVGKLCIAITIFVVSYIHLEWTRKRAGNWNATVLKCLFVAFVPTYVLAELLSDLTTLIVSILHILPEVFRVVDVLKDWRRCFASIGGMYIVPDSEAQDTTEQQGETPFGEAQPLLISMRDGAELRRHSRPWNTTTMLRIFLAIAASLAIIPLEHYLDNYYRYYIYGIDKRYVATVIGIATTSLATLLILVAHSEWSLVLPRGELNQARLGYQSLCARFILGVFLYEYQLTFPAKVGYNNFRPALLRIVFGPLIYGPYGWSLYPYLVIYLAFWSWIYWPMIQETTRLNWSLIWSCVLTIVSVIAVLDLVVMLIDDIAR